MPDIELKPHEFTHFQKMIYELAGISLTPAKKSLVQGRLTRRLVHHGLASFSEYYKLVKSQPAELQVAIDLLTTNETYFFREPRHFELLRERVLPEYKIKRLRGPSNPLRIWSAASSSGEEAYSLAMVCDDVLGATGWEVLGSDINASILDRARMGLYEMSRIEGIPKAYLKRYCLKGTGSYSGQLLIDASVRNKVGFMRLNLNDYLPDVGDFDIIFLRNVLIYFEMATKQKVVSRVLKRLNPGGWFFVSHSESLNGIQHDLVQQAPAVYRKEIVT